MRTTRFATIAVATCTALLLARTAAIDGDNAQPRAAANRPTSEQVRNIKANYASSRDGRGRAVFDPYYITLPEQERREWRQLKHAQQLTHVVLCPDRKSTR